MIYSIGYQRLNSVQFTRVLRQHRIGHVIDVRLNAWCPKPLYRAEQLNRFLTHLGITYEHHKELGANVAVAQYEPTPQQTALLQLLLEDIRRNTAVLCYEADHAACHRAKLLDSTKLPYEIIEPFIAGRIHDHEPFRGTATEPS